MFTSLQMNTDILAVSQEDEDWRIDLADSHAEIQLATSFISPSQALLIYLKKILITVKQVPKRIGKISSIVLML